MGVDLLDIRMRSEREFDIDIENFASELRTLIELAHSEASASDARPPWDITVQEVFSVVCNRIYHQHGRIPEDAWPRFVGILVEVLYAKPEEVTPQAYLVRDLGMA